MSTMIIQTESTPNPNALKFLPNVEVRGNKAPLFYKKDPQSNPEADAPVAYALFKIDGIEDVFFGSDFITVGKNDTVDGVQIKIMLKKNIDYHTNEHFLFKPKK